MCHPLLTIKTFFAKTGSPFFLLSTEALATWQHPGGQGLSLWLKSWKSRLWQPETHLPAHPRFNKVTKFPRPNECHTSVYLLFETLPQKEFATNQEQHSPNQSCCSGPKHRPHKPKGYCREPSLHCCHPASKLSR